MLEVENAAYAGFVACFQGCRNAGLGRVAPGRRADREEMAMEREKVRGTEREMARNDNIMNEVDWVGSWELGVGGLESDGR